MALERELETYKRKLPQLVEHEGKFALVHGDDFIDIYSSYDDALKAGYERFGLNPFLVKKISSSEEALFISRIFAPETFPRAS